MWMSHFALTITHHLYNVARRSITLQSLVTWRDFADHIGIINFVINLKYLEWRQIMCQYHIGRHICVLGPPHAARRLIRTVNVTTNVNTDNKQFHQLRVSSQVGDDDARKWNRRHERIDHHHTTTVLRPFYRDHPDEPVPEENFWTLWCNGRLTEADTPTIRLGATPSGLTSAHLHHPPYFYRSDALPAAQPTRSKHWRHT